MSKEKQQLSEVELDAIVGGEAADVVVTIVSGVAGFVSSAAGLLLEGAEVSQSVGTGVGTTWKGYRG